MFKINTAKLKNKPVLGSGLWTQRISFQNYSLVSVYNLSGICAANQFSFQSVQWFLRFRVPWVCKWYLAFIQAIGTVCMLDRENSDVTKWLNPVVPANYTRLLNYLSIQEQVSLSRKWSYQEGMTKERRDTKSYQQVRNEASWYIHHNTGCSQKNALVSYSPVKLIN